jgi:hypothetical protein
VASPGDEPTAPTTSAAPQDTSDLEPSTTATTTAPTTTTTAPRHFGEGECRPEQLASAVRWAPDDGADASSGSSELQHDGARRLRPAGAHTAAVEQITNSSRSACFIETNICGGFYRLEDAAGGPGAAPLERACAAFSAAVDLPPGASHQVRHHIPLFAPPGRYDVVVPGFDGSHARLPIELHDGIAACPTEDLSVRLNGERFSVEEGNSVSVSLIVESATDGLCTLRTAGAIAVTFRSAQTSASGHDGFPFWAAVPNDESANPRKIFLSAAIGPLQLPPGDYDVLAELPLADGRTLRAAGTAIVVARRQ